MPQTLTEIVGALPHDQRLGLTAIRVSYRNISDLIAELRYRPVGGQRWPDTYNLPVSATPDIETQIRELHASGLCGALDAAKYEGAGESGMDAALMGYPAWLIRTWYEPRKPGRPRQYEEPRQQISVLLPSALLDTVDAARGDESRNALIERLLREWLAD